MSNMSRRDSLGDAAAGAASTFAGKIKFDESQWTTAKKRSEEFAKFFT